MTRRNALQLLGLVAAGYGTSFVPRVARADNTVPKRIVFFYTTHGTLKQQTQSGALQSFWTPNAPGAPDALSITTPWSTDQHTLGELHTALVPYQKNLLFLDGIDMISAWVDTSATDSAHTAGRTHSMIANNRAGANLAGGISIDQYIAAGLNSPSPVTAIPSLQVASCITQNPINSSQNTPVYAGKGQPVSISSVPQDIYTRLFPNGPQDHDAAAAAKRLEQQKSVIEHVKQDFSRLSPKVSKLDKARLDAHASALTDLENRLALMGAACVEPQPSIVDTASSDNTGAAFTATTDVMLRLVQVALACDLTRVVTVALEEAHPDCFGFKQIGDASYFHAMIHETNGSVTNPLATNPDALTIVKNFHKYNTSQFVRLLDLLSSITEPDGTTLLDNTLVVWCGELGGGDHSLDHIPYVLAGKLGGAVNPGRYVRFPRKPSNLDPCSAQICAKSQGPSHRDFLATLATMVGVTTPDTFGNQDPRVKAGPLGGWAT